VSEKEREREREREKEKENTLRLSARLIAISSYK